MLDQYLESRKNAWSPQTAKTAKAIINRYAQAVEAKTSPEALIALLQASDISRYTQITYMMYLRGYWKWLHKEEAPYGQYIKANKQLFKNAYVRKKVPVTFDEVHNALHSLPQSLEREACLRMLLSAQRASEAGLFRKKGEENEAINETSILGKGGKLRPNFSPIATSPASYYRVYRYLKQHLGISPHSLRKLAMTRAADNGAGAADLCEIAGWSSIETAFIYLQPKQDARLKGLLK